MAASEEPTPTADESTAVAANMAGDAVGDPMVDEDGVNEAELAGEPGTMDERERAGRRGRDDDEAGEAP